MKIKNADITQIPPDSFVVIRIPKLEEFMRSTEFGEIHDYFESNEVTALFLDSDIKLELLSDDDLAGVGLKKVRH